MSILTLLLLIIILMSFRQAIGVLQGKDAVITKSKKFIAHIKSVGLFAFMFGLFTQLLGFYGAFTAIEIWGSITPDILVTGLWTSAIPSFYGMSIWLASYLFGYGLDRLSQVQIKA